MEKEKSRRIRAVLIVALAAALLVLCGCLISGDRPLVFLYRLFTLGYLPELEEKISLAVVFLFGFLTSFHCIGMCGGIVLSQHVGGDACGWARMRPGLLYQGGRILSYTLVGLLAGGIGTVIGFADTLKGVVPLLCGLITAGGRGVMQKCAGAVVVLLAVRMLLRAAVLF